MRWGTEVDITIWSGTIRYRWFRPDRKSWRRIL